MAKYYQDQQQRLEEERKNERCIADYDDIVAKYYQDQQQRLEEERKNEKEEKSRNGNYRMYCMFSTYRLLYPVHTNMYCMLYCMSTCSTVF